MQAEVEERVQAMVERSSLLSQCLVSTGKSVSSCWVITKGPQLVSKDASLVPYTILSLYPSSTTRGEFPNLPHTPFPLSF